MADLDARDMASLKLTVDRHGIVWALAGSRLPRSTKLDVATFLKSHQFSVDYNVRVVGTITNTPLIVELFHRRVKSEFSSLEVCSPLCCLDPADRDDPEVMLYSMRKFRRSPSLGGWHEFVIKDYPSYVLANYFTDKTAALKMLPSNMAYPEGYPKELLYHHPAWPYLSFIEGLDVDLCAELVATILDPRWYADPAPDGTDGDRMEQYLGLYPGISKDASTTRGKRYQMVLGCWKRSGGTLLKADGPQGFIWRIWAMKGGGEKGDVAACKCFMNYLRLTWTMALCSGPQSQHLFVPRYFFQNRDEVEAFSNHIGRFHPQP